MLIKDVKKLPPREVFFYWLKERHKIYLKRQAGLSPPWTDDEILQTVFFTSPYRENDKTTVWFRENVRDPLADDERVLFATVAFRWFNWIPTGVLLSTNYGWYSDTKHSSSLALNHSPLCRWDKERVLKLLASHRDKGEKIFTGAFLINSPPRKPKLEAIVDRIDNVWKARHKILHRWYDGLTMQSMHAILTEYDGLGGFMAYEIVCDLRYTYLLRDASDKMTWAHPGPGCVRGLYRINGWDWENKMSSHGYAPPKPKDWLQQMQKLLAETQKRFPRMPPFEMREIEHSLCEADKYMREMAQDGHTKRKYDAR